MARNKAWIEARTAYAAQKLGDGVICKRCKCTLNSFADRCQADLDEACEGFRTIDAAYSEFERKTRAA